jgi:nucleoside-diphosphate-sugar epimerase
MRVLITGGGGFVGARLARALLAQGRFDGQAIDEIVLTDQFEPPADLRAHPQVKVRVRPLLQECAALRDEPADRFDAVFHLASAVSGECEADFELGLRSIAVFGPDPAYPFPEIVGDDTLPMPQTSYGTQKLICEHLIADYTRKGYIDGRAARLVTVTVRPGRPNGAASSFFSGIIREPLAGEDAILPVSTDVRHPVATVHTMVRSLIAVGEASREAFVGRSAITLPGLNVSVQQMLDALEAVAGPRVRARVKPQHDARIAGIVANWPRGVSTPRAHALGLHAEASFEDIIRLYIEDCRHDNPQALKGMD